MEYSCFFYSYMDEKQLEHMRQICKKNMSKIREAKSKYNKEKIKYNQRYLKSSIRDLTKSFIPENE